MTEIRDLPSLKILPVNQLIVHEHHDPQRSPLLTESIKMSQVLRNPPIVVPFHDGSQRYMVLDGANRVISIQNLGLPHIVVQVVEADDPGLDLSSWNHVIWGAIPDVLLDWARSVPGLSLLPCTEENLFRGLLDIRSLAILHLADGQIFTVYTQEIELIHRVKALTKLVNCYSKRTNMDRTTNYTIDPLRSLYPDLSGLVLLPPYRLEDVLDLVSQGHLMPTGSTRFTIAGRALNVKFPLKILENGQSLEQKRAWLQDWLKDSLSRKRVRYYAEPIFMFDE